MTNTQHTPGPWRVEIDYLGTTTICTEDDLIAELPTSDPDNVNPANARLIAAAPELLAALQDCVAVPNKNRPDEVWQRARAAIAKATGK